MSETPPNLPPTPATSKLAIASLVTGILSTFCSLVVGVPAAIMGIVALSKIKKSNGLLNGQGLAIAGICTGLFCGLIGTASLAGLAAPLVLRQRHKADQMMVKAHMVSFYAQAMEIRQSSGAPPDAKAAQKLLSKMPVPRINSGEWIYFPEASPAGPRTPLLVSPIIGRQQLLLQSDGSIIFINPDDTGNDATKSIGAGSVTIPATID